MLDGLIAIDRAAGAIPEQIYRALRGAAREGRLRPGMELPSSRRLAEVLGISRNSVNAGYELLRAEGVIAVRQGAVPAIAETAVLDGVAAEPNATAPQFSARGAALSSDLRSSAYMRRDGLLQPGTPDEALFPTDLWARALRRAARRRYGEDAIYAHADGLPALKAILVDYLRQSRGIVAGADELIVLPTTQAGLVLAAQCLCEPGQAAWMETPGYFGARAAFEGAGLSVVPMPVDAEGADVEAITADAPLPRILYVTPSHQYPTGARMTLGRRQTLLNTARTCGALVLEDDYDSEFLWHGRAIAALQGLSAVGEVIYFGTTAKSLLPGLRLAYMVAPPALAELFRRAQRNMGMLANLHAQAAFADLVESGHYGTQLKRITRIYEARGRLLVETLRARLGDRICVTMPMGGLQMAVDLPGVGDDRTVALAMARAGFNAPALSAYCIGASRPGLVVGFSQADAPVVEQFAQALERALDTEESSR